MLLPMKRLPRPAVPTLRRLVATTGAPSAKKIYGDPDLAESPYCDVDLPSLMNSFVVYKLCQSEKLVESAPMILERMQALGLSGVSNRFIKMTFFKHFCGGETKDELKVVQEALKERNIGSILDYAIEAEYDETKPFVVDEAVESSRAFVDKLMSTIEWCLYGLKPIFIAKVTSLLSPKALIAWSNTLNLFKTEFEALAAATGGKMSLSSLKTLAVVFPEFDKQPKVLEKAFAEADLDKDGFVDYVDVLPVFSMHYPEYMDLLVNCTPKDPGKYFFGFLDAPCSETLKRSLPLSDTLVKAVHSYKLVMTIDAEQTYFHPAIDDFAIGFAKKYTYAGSPAIYNTYQMYLKNSEKKLRDCYQSSIRLKIPFGLKIVRGAYIRAERDRAKELGYEDPLHPTYEATNHCYNSNVAFMIDEMAKNSKTTPIAMLIATHNQDSALMALDRIISANVQNPNISFGQLYGMKDSLTAYLSKTPFTAYKYIPYGPVEITVPYLIRRAIENKGMLSRKATPKKGSKIHKNEDDLVMEEILSRLPSKSLFSPISSPKKQ